MAYVVAAAGSPSPPRPSSSRTRARLAGYKKPSTVYFVDQLPRNAAGKVAKRELRARHDAALPLN